MYKIQIPRQLGKIIKEKRLQAGLTQEQLAQLSNTSRSLIYRLEKGVITGIMFDKLFSVLKVLELELAVIDTQNPPSEINEISLNNKTTPPQPEKDDPAVSTATGRKTKRKNNPNRNTQKQFEKELKALQNIEGLDFKRYIKG